jgi:hypothetical protein
VCITYVVSVPRLSRVNRRNGTAGYRRRAPLGPAFFRLAAAGFLEELDAFRLVDAGLAARDTGGLDAGLDEGFGGLAGRAAGTGFAAVFGWRRVTTVGSLDIRTRSKPSSAGRYVQTSLTFALLASQSRLAVS